MVWDETRNQKVMGLSPSTVCWMETFTLICGKNCIDVCLKKTENKKRGREGPFLTKITKF